LRRSHRRTAGHLPLFIFNFIVSNRPGSNPANIYRMSYNINTDSGQYFFRYRPRHDEPAVTLPENLPPPRQSLKPPYFT